MKTKASRRGVSMRDLQALAEGAKVKPKGQAAGPRAERGKGGGGRAAILDRIRRAGAAVSPEPDEERGARDEGEGEGEGEDEGAGADGTGADGEPEPEPAPEPEPEPEEVAAGRLEGLDVEAMRAELLGRRDDQGRPEFDAKKLQKLKDGAVGEKLRDIYTWEAQDAAKLRAEEAAAAEAEVAQAERTWEELKGMTKAGKAAKLKALRLRSESERARKKAAAFRGVGKKQKGCCKPVLLDYEVDETETDGYVYWDETTRRTLGWVFLRFKAKVRKS